MSRNRGDEGFLAFFRAYTQTWLHTVSTVALTAFGLLTFVDRLFVVVAIGAYVLPPVIQYFRRPAGGVPEPPGDATPAGESADGGGDTRAESGSGERVNPATDARTNRSGDARTNPPGDARRVSDGTGAAAGGVAADDDEPEIDDAEADGSERDEPERGDSEEVGPEAEPEWTAADAPADETLFDAAVASTGAYAVGAGGTVLARDGGEWTVVLADGPGAASNGLRGVDAVDGGGVWVAGDSGAVGRIDPETGRHVDHSAPGGDTSAISGVAATDDGGVETVLLTDSSGRVRRGRYRDGELAWEEPTKPGSGSSISGVDFRAGVGYVCDTAGGVFRTDDGGRTFDGLDFESGGETPTDVAAVGESCLVATDGGTVRRRDGSAWTPDRLTETALLALAGDDAGCVAVGESEAYERFSSPGWTRAATPALGSLRGVAVDGEWAVAVGDDGTIVERA